MTGNVSQGRTCEYLITQYDPVTGSPNNTNTYDITVDVEYVNSDTYLGVYKYNINTQNTELVEEAGAGFTGAIETTVTTPFEIYVQMYPNSTSSSAIFNISSAIVVNTGGNNTTSNTTGNSTTPSTNTTSTATTANTTSTTTTTNTTSTTTDSGISGGGIVGFFLAVFIVFFILSLC